MEGRMKQGLVNLAVISPREMKIFERVPDTLPFITGLLRQFNPQNKICLGISCWEKE